MKTIMCKADAQTMNDQLIQWISESNFEEITFWTEFEMKFDELTDENYNV